jgi:hypothetical protein
LAMTYYRLLKFKRQAKLRYRRLLRNSRYSIEKRQRRLNRQINKYLRRIKKTRLAQTFYL